MTVYTSSNKLDEFTLGYIYSALWELEKQYDIPDICPNDVRTIIQDCMSFQEKNKELIKKLCQTTPTTYLKISSDHLGHDYWLARNGKTPDFLSRASSELVQKFNKASQQEGARKIILDGEDLKIIKAS